MSTAHKIVGFAAFAVAFPFAMVAQQNYFNHAAAVVTQTGPSQELIDFNVSQRYMDGQLQVLMFKYDCTTDTSHWPKQHPGTYPKSMVVQFINKSGQFTWSVGDVPWSMKPSGNIVKMLCMK